jgi:hypothetical protein
MTTSEIISSVIAILALIISGVTAYLTFFAKFKARILVKRRVILTKIKDVPCVVLECEFFNEGAKQCLIEDVILTIIHNETGTEYKFYPQYTRPQYNIFALYKMSDFSTFSGLSLKPKDRREVFIAFRPTLRESFSPQSGTFAIYVATDDGKATYKVSAPTFSIHLTEDGISKWVGDPAEARQLEAIEIGENRQQFFSNRKK